MSTLLLSADLATSSRVTGAAARQDAHLTVATSVDRLCELAAAAPMDLVLLDLTFADLALVELIPRLRALTHPPRAILAFGPHVHTARLVEAKAAGCDEVLSRGQFHAQVDQILAR